MSVVEEDKRNSQLGLDIQQHLTKLGIHTPIIPTNDSIKDKIEKIVHQPINHIHLGILQLGWSVYGIDVSSIRSVKA